MTCPAIGSPWARSPKLARARPTRRDRAARTTFDLEAYFFFFFHAHLHEGYAWRLQGLEKICRDVDSRKINYFRVYNKHTDHQSMNPIKVSEFVCDRLLEGETR